MNCILTTELRTVPGEEIRRPDYATSATVAEQRDVHLGASIGMRVMQ